MLHRAILACWVIQFVASAPSELTKAGCPDANAGFHAEMLNTRFATNEYLEYDDEYLFEMETNNLEDGFIAGERYRFEIDENDGELGMRGVVVVATQYGKERSCGFGEFPPQNWVSASRDCPNVAMGEFKPTDMAGFHWKAPQCGCVMFKVAVLTQDDEYFMDSDSTIAGPLTRVVCEQRSNAVPNLDSSDVDDVLGVLDPEFYGLEDLTDAVTDALVRELEDEVDELFGVDSMEDDLTEEIYDDSDLESYESSEDSSDDDKTGERGGWRGVDSHRRRAPRGRWAERRRENGRNPIGHSRFARRFQGRMMKHDTEGWVVSHRQDGRRGARGGQFRRERAPLADTMMADAPAADVEEDGDEAEERDRSGHRRSHHHRRGHHGRHHGHEHAHDKDYKMDKICQMTESDTLSPRKEAWLNRMDPEVAAMHRQHWEEKAARVRECCEMETQDDKEACFRIQHTARLDSYCAGEVGHRRVNRRIRGVNRSILKDTCCQKEGEERYECFHNKHHTLREEKTPERKMEFICSKLERAPTRHRRVLKRLDEDDRDDWESVFDGRRESLANCCERDEIEDRLECMNDLRKERVDAMCDESVEIRPYDAMRRGDRRRSKHESFKEQCCHLDEEARYTCFNNTMWQRKQAWMGRSRGSPCESGNSEECNPHQGHVECCEAGKTFGMGLDDASYRVCRASAIDYAKAQTMGRICMAKYKSCCMMASGEDTES